MQPKSHKPLNSPPHWYLRLSRLQSPLRKWPILAFQDLFLCALLEYTDCDPTQKLWAPKMDQNWRWLTFYSFFQLSVLIFIKARNDTTIDLCITLKVAVTFIKTATALACQSPIQAWCISSSICISALDLLHMYKSSSFHVCTCVHLITSSTILFIVLQIYWKKPLVPNFLIFLWNERHFLKSGLALGWVERPWVLSQTRNKHCFLNTVY